MHKNDLQNFESFFGDASKRQWLHHIIYLLEPYAVRVAFNLRLTLAWYYLSAMVTFDGITWGENWTKYSPISAVIPNSGEIASFAKLWNDPPTRALKYSFRTSSPFPCSDQLLREYITTTSGNIRPSWSPSPQPPHVKSPLVHCQVCYKFTWYSCWSSLVWVFSAGAVNIGGWEPQSGFCQGLLQRKQYFSSSLILISHTHTN